MKFIEFSDKLVNLDKVNFVQLTEVDGADELTFCFSDGCKLKSTGIKTDMYDGVSSEFVTYAYLKDILIEKKNDEGEYDNYDDENEMPPSEEEFTPPCPQKRLSAGYRTLQKITSLNWKPMLFLIVLFVLIFSSLLNITKPSRRASRSDGEKYSELNDLNKLEKSFDTFQLPLTDEEGE